MKVEELIVDGFKSYATRTVISGWDPQFNAITGLNGSGKSNILDAICFVLGIASMATVRAQNLQDLIYKRGQAGVTKASVTIVFDNSETLKSPIGFETFPKISVTRQIILGGNSKYLINGHKAQQQTVLNLFQSVQLNINNPNFLIMQGKITKVLNMKASEILSLIEEAAGTRTFEERKEKAQRTMAKKDNKLIEIRNLLREEIDPKLEKLRNEKRTYLEYQQTQTDLEKLARVLAAHDYVKYSQRFNNNSTELNEKETDLHQKNGLVTTLTDEIENLAHDLDAIKKKKEAELKMGSKLKDLETIELTMSEELTRLNTLIDIKHENLAGEQSRLKTLKQSIQLVRDSILGQTGEYSSFEQQYTLGKSELTKLKETYAQKEELLSTLSTGVSLKGSTNGGYTAQLKEAKSRLNDAQVFIKESKIKIAHLTQQTKADKPKLDAAQIELDKIDREKQQRLKEIAAQEQELTDKGVDTNAVPKFRRQEQEILQQLKEYQYQIEKLGREINGLDFNYTKPSKDFDARSVKGVAAQLFSLLEEHTDKALALQVCAGGRLFNIVVDTSDTASQLLENGRLTKRVTIIPLDKISARSMDDRIVNAAKQLRPGKVDLALNMIGYEHELTKAMAYIFGNTLICQDPETAKTVTFDPKIRARSITIDGDVYDPEGNLSGGSRKNNKLILLITQKYNSLNNSKAQLEKSLSETRIELTRAEKLNESSNSLQKALNLSRHELGLLEKKLSNSSAAEMKKRFDFNLQEIKSLEGEINTTEGQSKEIQREIQKTEKDIQEFSTDKGSKLKQLENEVNQLAKVVKAKEKQIGDAFEKYQAAQMEQEQQESDLKNLEQDEINLSRSIQELNSEISGMEKSIAELSSKLETTRGRLEDERATFIGLNEELQELTSVLEAKNQFLSDTKLSIQKLNHEIEKNSSINKGLKSHLDLLIKEHDWVLDNNVLQSIIEQYPNVNVEEIRSQVEILKERFQGMRRKVNTNIMNMIDNVEKKEISLVNMIRTIEKDKSKIENTVEKLNGYKRSTLDATYKKVSLDFGNIFADLLPGSFAKLVPVDEEDVTKGLEVKVKLGPVWKASLVELSGGQRSLIALSLILALLQFKPAPMYILDEVDAALDLSHTQNIGHLIKTRFKGSQFIVVSLKEGMFTNANRVFRTRFQDGTSVVSVM